jgi:hypothetical protein
MLLGTCVSSLLELELEWLQQVVKWNMQQKTMGAFSPPFPFLGVDRDDPGRPSPRAEGGQKKQFKACIPFST